MVRGYDFFPEHPPLNPRSHRNGETELKKLSVRSLFAYCITHVMPRTCVRVFFVRSVDSTFFRSTKRPDIYRRDAGRFTFFFRCSCSFLDHHLPVELCNKGRVLPT